MNDLRERLATMTPEELKAESFEREIGEWRAVIARQMIDAWNGEAL